MSSSYRIQNLAGGLLIRSHRETKSWERLLIACVAGGVAWGVTSSLLKIWWCVSFAFVIAIGVFLTARGDSAELRATNVEFASRGHAGRRGPRHLSSAGDVRRLEFQDPTGKVRGLYAVTDRRDFCLLDYEETMEVIQAIENRFRFGGAMARKLFGWRCASF